MIRKINMKKTMKKTIKKNVNKKTKHKINKQDNTYIIVKCYFPGEDDLQYQYLEQILKKYNISSNHYINNIRKEDYKLLNIQHVKKCNDITKLKKININNNNDNNNINNNNKILNPSIIFFNITYINLNIRYYGIETLLSNVLTRDKINSIENKSNLYHSFNNYNKKLADKYLPLTFNINELEKYKFGKTIDNEKYYILKPVDSMGGVDIIYVSSIEEVQNAIEYYKTHKNYRNRIYGNNVITQEYITKPLLYYKTNYTNTNANKNANGDIKISLLGYKCHFRVPFVVSYIHKKINSFILEDGIRILTAKEPYNMELPFQKEVHDTHIKSSSGDFFLKNNSEDYKNLQITLSQRDEIINEFKKISKILEKMLQNDNNKWLYPEHKNAFHIFGIDFMIEDNREFDEKFDKEYNKELDNGKLNIKLIEVNNSPSFIFHNKSNTHTQSKLLFQELDKHIFSKIF